MVEDINFPERVPAVSATGRVNKVNRKKRKKRKKEKKNPTKLILQVKPKSTRLKILLISRVQPALQEQKMMLIRKQLMFGSKP
jgi:hypothetical protein